MADKSGIEWTDATWNPIRGCSRVSEGCRNCYAEKVAYRFSDAGRPYHGLVGIGGKWNGTIKFVEEHLLDPLRWKKPRRIFVNSMSDLFHEHVTDAMLDQIFAVMALCPQHTFQVLTKRPQRMLEYSTRADHYFRIKLAAEAIQRERKMEFDRSSHRSPDFIAHVQLGVSVENQKAAEERIPLLLQTPAAVRFISAEPLLGTLNIRRYVGAECTHEDSYLEDDTNAMVCRKCEDTPMLDWVIVGGESGPGARPMHPDWARSLRDQCKSAGVPFFFKQWGEWAPSTAKPIRGEHTGGGLYLLLDGRAGCQGDWWDGKAAAVDRVGKKIAGALLDGVEHREFPA